MVVGSPYARTSKTVREALIPNQAAPSPYPDTRLPNTINTQSRHVGLDISLQIALRPNNLLSYLPRRWPGACTAAVYFNLIHQSSTAVVGTST